MTNESMAVKTTAAINMLAGLWLFASPWIYHAASSPNAWNSRIVGAFILSFAATRVSKPLITRGASFINLLFGVWVFSSPWIFRYTNSPDRFINSLCVGAIVFILGAIGSSMGHLDTPGGPSPLRP